MELWQLDCKACCRVSGISAFYLKLSVLPLRTLHIPILGFVPVHLDIIWLHAFCKSLIKSNHCTTSLRAKLVSF